MTLIQVLSEPQIESIVDMVTSVRRCLRGEGAKEDDARRESAESGLRILRSIVTPAWLADSMRMGSPAILCHEQFAQLVRRCTNLYANAMAPWLSGSIRTARLDGDLTPRTLWALIDGTIVHLTRDGRVKVLSDRSAIPTLLHAGHLRCVSPQGATSPLADLQIIANVFTTSVHRTVPT